MAAESLYLTRPSSAACASIRQPLRPWTPALPHRPASSMTPWSPFTVAVPGKCHRSYVFIAMHLCGNQKRLPCAWYQAFPGSDGWHCCSRQPCEALAKVGVHEQHAAKVLPVHGHGADSTVHSRRQHEYAGGDMPVAGRLRTALLRVRISDAAAPGHLLLLEPQWRYLGLPPRTHAKLTRVAEPAPRSRPLAELNRVLLPSIIGEPRPPLA